MAKDIPRAIVKQIVRDYQNGRLQNLPRQEQTSPKDNIYWVYNNTNSVINPGSLVQIVGFAGISAYEQAYSAMLNNQLAFVVTTPSSGSGSGSVAPTSLATSIDCISANSVNLGRIRYDGLTFVLVHINDDTHTEVSATGESVASDGACVIVAKSPKNSTTNYAVCAVAKKVGSGGGGSPAFTPVLNDMSVGLKLSGTAASSITAVTDLNVVNGALVIGFGIITLDSSKSTISVVKSLS